MVEIAVLLIVLAVIFAAKVATVVFAADDTISKSVSFSWMAAKPEDTIIPEAETMGAEQKSPVASQTFRPHARFA